MNRRLPYLTSLFLGLALATSAGQEPRPLNNAERLKIDSFASGDPLEKQPLGAGDDMPVLRAERPAPKKVKGPTEITSNKLHFDQQTNHAVFTGDVVVKDPEFNVQCDKLTAVLKSRGKAKAAGDRPAADPPPANPAPGNAPDRSKPAKGGGLERAIAEGNVFITQEKVEADGSTSENTGKAQKAVYDAITGEITLSGSPEATHGANRVIAEEPDTRLIFTRDGKMRAEGKAKYILQDAPEKKR